MDFHVIPIVTSSGPATIIRFFDDMRPQGFEVTLYESQVEALIEALERNKYRPVWSALEDAILPKDES